MKKFINILISLCIITMIISGTMLAVYFYSANRSRNEFQGLASEFYSEKPKASIKDQKPREDTSQTDDLVNEEEVLKVAFENLYAKNNDMVAWLAIKDTDINYPVMHTLEDPEYYLRRNFAKEYSFSGVPFMDARSSLEEPTDNILIHGHHMKDGSMFAQLLSYKDREFLQAHPTIELYVPFEKREYDIISVFPTEAYIQNKNQFNYYDFIDASAEEDFDAYVQSVRDISLFDTGISAEYGDSLLTLSTCAYHTTQGRFVVVGRYKNDEN